MSDPMYDYTIDRNTIFVKGSDNMPDPLLNFDKIGIFGVIKCRSQPANDLYFCTYPNVRRTAKSSFIWTTRFKNVYQWSDQKFGVQFIESKSHALRHRDGQSFEVSVWYIGRGTLNIIDNDVAAVAENDEFTKHIKIQWLHFRINHSVFRSQVVHGSSTSSRWKSVHVHTDSVVYYSPTGEHLIPPRTTGAMGL